MRQMLPPAPLLEPLRTAEAIEFSHQVNMQLLRIFRICQSCGHSHKRREFRRTEILERPFIHDVSNTTDVFSAMTCLAFRDAVRTAKGYPHAAFEEFYLSIDDGQWAQYVLRIHIYEPRG